MSLPQDILKWAKTRPKWQRDAIARLFKKPDLDDTDIQELLELIKIENGITQGGRTPQEPTADLIPSENLGSKSIKLLAIKNLKNVNALAEEQTLPIAESGLTVIYGGNGSGKSGYGRLLKKACRARTEDEILPNLTAKQESHSPAEAVFEVQVNNETKDCRWVVNTPPPDELSSFSVFDTQCVLSYLNEEGDSFFAPQALDVLKKLTETCSILKSKLEQEKPIAAPLSGIQITPNTEAARFIATLSASTDPQRLKKLTDLSEEETRAYDTSVRDLKENDPEKKAKELEGITSGLIEFSEKLESRIIPISTQSIAVFRELIDEHLKAKSTEKLIIEYTNGSESLLAGTGGEAWRDLFEAARRFAIASHPSVPFPPLDKGSPCPLCQQPLQPDGLERLANFDKFIKQDAAKRVKKLRGSISSTHEAIKKLDIAPIFSVAYQNQISDIEPELTKEIIEYERLVTIYKTEIIDSINNRDWNRLTSLTEPESPVNKINDVIANLKSRALNLKKSVDRQYREKAQAQNLEIEGRISLRKARSAIESRIEGLKLRDKYDACIAEANPATVSRKITELSNKYVSEELGKALNKEFRELGVHGLSIKSQSRTDRGRQVYKLKLALKTKAKPTQVLSEGEQRAIALGAFLAEAQHNSQGIILDDPMSSLDHKRRERVAKRLARESHERQVIIFTHDIYYIHILEEEARSEQASIRTLAIDQTSKGFGSVQNSLPFEGQKVSDRMKELEEDVKKVRSTFNDGNMNQYRIETFEVYRKLRDTWELTIEEILLQKIITRFKNSVQTGCLKRIVVEDSDWHQVDAGMSKCSRYTGHNRTTTGSIDVPAPDELQQDIDRLEGWHRNIKNRANKLNKKTRDELLGVRAIT